jgi:rRNA maturation endonuclease Nob1
VSISYVVDTGVLLSNWVQARPEAKLVTTENILDEVKNRPSTMRVEFLISTGRLTISRVEEQNIEAARRAAAHTGDISVLSAHDTELLGLGHQLLMNGYNVILVSTDLAVLNTAHFLGLKIDDPLGRMKHSVQWLLKCPACSHTSRISSETKCPICGTVMKRHARKRSKIR